MKIKTKTTIGSTLVTAGVLCLSGMSAQADHHMEMQFAPGHIMSCSYKDGKDSDDLDNLTKAFNKWSKKNGAGYTYYLLYPEFHDDPSSMDFGWVGSWASAADFGGGYDAWIKDGGDAAEMFAETADCNNSMTAVTPIATPEDGAPWESGVVWFRQCMHEDGATLGDAVAAHRTSANAMVEMGVPSASWAFLPVLGFGDPTYDYYHVQGWPSHSALGAVFDSFFNKGGWKLAAQSEKDTMSCHSPNLYTFRLMHSPQS